MAALTNTTGDLSFGEDAIGVGLGAGGSGLPAAANAAAGALFAAGGITNATERREAGVGGSTPLGVDGSDSLGGSFLSPSMATFSCPDTFTSSLCPGIASLPTAPSPSFFEGTNASSRPPASPCIRSVYVNLKNHNCQGGVSIGRGATVWRGQALSRTQRFVRTDRFRSCVFWCFVRPAHKCLVLV